VSETAGQPPSALPESLADVWPLVGRYGIADDVEREKALEAAGRDGLEALVEAVNHDRLAEIEGFVEAHGDSEEAVRLAALARAAQEARLILETPSI
jgi:hypothetical protein